jgi:hypothetical protein
MGGIEHALKSAHGLWIQASVPPIPDMMIKGNVLRLTDIKLWVDRCRCGVLWKKGASLVNKLSMNPEWVRPSSSRIESRVQLPPHWGHGKCMIVLANMLAKSLPNPRLGSEQVIQLRRNTLDWRKGDLSLKTTHPKLGAAHRGVTQTLI